MCRTPITVFQVRAPGLRIEFPPLRALDTSPGNLRPATNSFIGRESDVAEVQAAVRAHRLVTLTGVGGVGKTRLATEVAARLADEFPDGVWVFELAAVTDPAAVPDAVAAVLGITQQPGKTVSESCGRRVGGQGPVVGVRQLRARARRRRRSDRSHPRAVGDGANRGHQPRRIGGRRRASVAGALAGCRRRNRLCGSDSVRRARPECGAAILVADADEADAVLEICRRLDGIPLAIELAASRMASMTASEVRDRLDDRFRLLVGSRRGLERHHTLRHTVAWSYDLLDDAEQPC